MALGLAQGMFGISRDFRQVKESRIKRLVCKDVAPADADVSKDEIAQHLCLHKVLISRETIPGQIVAFAEIEVIVPERAPISAAAPTTHDLEARPAEMKAFLRFWRDIESMCDESHFSRY